MTHWPPSATRLAAAERRYARAEHGQKTRARRDYEATVHAQLRADVEYARIAARQLSLPMARRTPPAQGSRADVGAA